MHIRIPRRSMRRTHRQHLREAEQTVAVETAPAKTANTVNFREIFLYGDHTSQRQHGTRVCPSNLHTLFAEHNILLKRGPLEGEIHLTAIVVLTCYHRHCVPLRKQIINGTDRGLLDKLKRASPNNDSYARGLNCGVTRNGTEASKLFNNLIILKGFVINSEDSECN